MILYPTNQSCERSWRPWAARMRRLAERDRELEGRWDGMMGVMGAGWPNGYRGNLNDWIILRSGLARAVMHRTAQRTQQFSTLTSPLTTID